MEDREMARMHKYGESKRLELWWQLYRTSLPVWDLENFRPMDFCWHECTMFYLTTVMLYTLFLHSHISSCCHTFRCLLTPSSVSFNPNTVPSQHITCLCALISCMLIIVLLWKKKTTNLNRQLISVHKYLMCCEGTTVGLKLPGEGVNKHWRM